MDNVRRGSNQYSCAEVTCATPALGKLMALALRGLGYHCCRCMQGVCEVVIIFNPRVLRGHIASDRNFQILWKGEKLEGQITFRKV